jgi:hypothetical protein
MMNIMNVTRFKPGDMVKESGPPFLFKGADNGLVLHVRPDGWIIVMWDTGLKRRCYWRDLVISRFDWEQNEV